MVSAAGRRFITGTAARIRPVCPLQRRIFCSRLRQPKNFRSVQRRGGLGKRKSVAKFGADGCVWSVCVRACGAGKIYRKANCTLGTAGGTARDVTSTIRAPVFNCRMFPSLRLDWSLGWLRFTKILLATPERQILLQNSKNMINKAFYFSEGG